MSLRRRRVGSDSVEWSGDRLTIMSPAGPMEDWEVRRHRAALIRFDGRTWRVVTQTTVEDGHTRYDLVPWTPLEGELTGPRIDYSPEHVTLRDYARAIGRRRGRVTVLLDALRPFLGFLPARTKGWLETSYGIDPVASTFASIFMQFLIGLAALALAAIGTMVTVFVGPRHGIPVAYCVVLAGVVWLDAAVRWSRLLAEERPAPGFYEWMIRRAR